MPEFVQRTIEYFFTKYGVSDSNLKAKILPEVTDIIYDYNMHVVNYEKELDEYKRKQILTGLQELDDKLDDIFKEMLGKHGKHS